MRALPMWVIYDHPRDYPKHFVARMWLAKAGETHADANVMLDTELPPLRERLQRQGLVCLARHPDDDPAIVEVWL